MLQYGGALSLDANCYATLTGCSFDNCAATSSGDNSTAVRCAYTLALGIPSTYYRPYSNCLSWLESDAQYIKSHTTHDSTRKRAVV